MSYQILVNNLIKEKDLKSTDDPVKRTQIIKDKKGRTVELSYSALERMSSLETYLILKSVF